MIPGVFLAHLKRDSFCRMNHKLLVFLSTYLFLCLHTVCAQSCHFFGEKNAAATEHTLRTSPSCSAAYAYLSKCAWGSSADVNFAEIVRSRCEKDFIQKLSASQKKVYADKSSLCADEFAHQDGSLALSEESTCLADVAFQFATNITKASRPLPRASFDCVKAKSPLEITICAYPDLGRQDLLMARSYFSFFKAIKGADRKALLDNQRAWNERIPAECRLSSLPASPAVASCLVGKYKARVSALDACGIGLDIVCITNDDSFSQH